MGRLCQRRDTRPGGAAAAARAQTPRSHLMPSRTDDTGDSGRFIERLRALGEHPFAPARTLFATGSEVVVARAPGRLDVMGGIADYSGALVLQWPIREATFAAVQPTAERLLRIVSLSDAGAP